MIKLLERFGSFIIRISEETGLWFTALGRTIAWAFRPPYELNEWLRQIERLRRAA